MEATTHWIDQSEDARSSREGSTSYDGMSGTLGRRHVGGATWKYVVFW